jgi:hypothetical protein
VELGIEGAIVIKMLCPIAVGNVVSWVSFQGRNLTSDFIRSESIVGIKPLNEFALSVSEAKIAGVIASKLRAVKNFEGAGRLNRQILSDGYRIVCGAIINEDNFEIFVGLLETAFEAIKERRTCIPTRNDD